MGLENCRLCGRVANNGLHIFGPEGLKLSMGNVLLQHFRFQVSKVDTFSKIVCKKCWRTTDQFHKLYCSVEIYTANLMGASNEIEIKKEVKSLYLKPNQNCNAAEAISPKMEFHSFMNVIKSEENESSDKSDKISIESYCSVVKKPRSMVSRTRKRKINNLSETIDKEISEWIELCCDICKVVIETFTGLKKHFRTEHNVPGYIKCCEHKFTERCRLYEHMQKHKCPELLTCNVCGKVCEDKHNFKRHIKIHSTLGQPYQCSGCPKRYKTRGNLNLHFRRIHGSSPEQYLCDICNKSFSAKQALGFHLLRVHVGHTFVCDVCGKVFKAPTELKIHNKYTHTGYISPKFNCTICGRWLSNKKHLQRHTRRIHQAIKEKCDICDKECPNKSSLSEHKRYAHGGKLYECNICSKHFKSKIRLKEHISRHMGINLYKCLYCTMEFISNSDMYKHRKNAHPYQWQLHKERRYINPELNADERSDLSTLVRQN